MEDHERFKVLERPLRNNWELPMIPGNDRKYLGTSTSTKMQGPDSVTTAYRVQSTD